MAEQLKSIISNLEDCFDGKPWYGDSVMKKLNQINWEIVNEKIYGNKTIAVLLKHMINWRVFVLKKLEGDVVFNIVIDGENDWDEVHIANQEEWNALLQDLRTTQQNLLQNLALETDGLLNQKVPGKEYTFGPILTSIAQHDIYHLGQIAMLNSISKN